jgi:molybdate transport system ATP-binding protein
MSFDVDIQKTVHSERRSFTLRVRFATHARRCVIYGPSGAGKSLTLQAIAGLLKPDRGRIAFGDDVLFDHGAGIDVPARRREFGYLFQDYALFPKLNVRQNIAFGLRNGLRNPSPKVSGESVERWLRALELVDVAARSRARSCMRRAHCCSTSRFRRSTRSCENACAPSSTNCSSASTFRS